MSQPAASSHPPVDTVPSPLFREENALFVGIAFESIFYGIAFLLYCLTMRNFLKRNSQKDRQKMWSLMGFLTIQQVALFIAVLCNIQFGVLAFVYHRDTPGGPVTYQITHSNVPPAYASLAAFVICNWFQDIVLLHRFVIIYNKWYKLYIFPCMLFLASVAFSLILLIQVSGHPGLLNVGNNLPVSTVYFSLTVSLNVILTLMIMGRIFYCAMATTNETRLPSHYISVLAMVVESAALSAVTGLALIITLHTNAAASEAIVSLYGVMTVVSPVLITYRVSIGAAWSRSVSDQMSNCSGPFVAAPAGGSRTALGSTGTNDIILKVRRHAESDGSIRSKPSRFLNESEQEV